MVKASQQNAKNSAFRLEHFVAPNKKKIKGQNQRTEKHEKNKKKKNETDDFKT